VTTKTNQAINDAIRAAAGYSVAQAPSAPGPQTAQAAVRTIPPGNAGNGTGAALPQPVRRSMNDFLRAAHLQSYINRSFNVG